MEDSGIVARATTAAAAGPLIEQVAMEAMLQVDRAQVRAPHLHQAGYGGTQAANTLPDAVFAPSEAA